MPMIRSVLAAVKKADETFALVDPGDVIALGISGGKDSMGLLLAMHLYTKFSKKDFRVVPISLDLGFPGFDVSAQVEYCKSLGLELQVIDAKEVYPILQQHTKPGHHVPCSICSRMKKAAINDAAKKLGCNKVAFAHHNDDALETLWMNMIHGGAVATFEPKMHLDRADVTFIRPFIFVREEQLVALVEEEHLPVLGKTCPADGYTERQYCKELLQKLYEERPEARTNFTSMLYNYDAFRLYFDHVEFPNPINPHLSLKPVLSAEDVLKYESLGLRALSGNAKHFLIQKDHVPVGAISYRLDNPHLISIVMLECVDKEIAKEALLHFAQYFSCEINPIRFAYADAQKDVAVELGYQYGIPPYREDYTKRYNR